MKKWTILGCALGVCVANLADSGDADAAFHRLPAAVCQAEYGSGSYGGSQTTGGFKIGPGTGVIATNAVCPFDDQTNYLDTGVLSIVADLYNPTGSSENSGTLSLQACVYSGFSTTCGSATSSPSIAAGSHAGVTISDISAWTNDSGHGYSYVALNEVVGSTNFVAGILFNF